MPLVSIRGGTPNFTGEIVEQDQLQDVGFFQG
jgi:hypothetical protein